MPRLYKMFLLLCLVVPIRSEAQQSDKERLCIEILTAAKTYEDIESALKIIKTMPGIYKYIPSQHPIAGKNQPSVSSSYGSRIHPITKRSHVHTGIDFVAAFATTIHATAAGTVIHSGGKGGYGKCVIIEHKYGFRTVYGHLTACYALEGREVKKGEIIGFLGNTGNSTGAHLHYEVIKNNRHINPVDFICEE